MMWVVNCISFSYYPENPAWWSRDECKEECCWGVRVCEGVDEGMGGGGYYSSLSPPPPPTIPTHHQQHH